MVTVFPSPDSVALAEPEEVVSPWAESVPPPKYFNRAPGEGLYNL